MVVVVGGGSSSMRAAVLPRIDGRRSRSIVPGQAVATQPLWPLMVGTVRVCPFAGFVKA